MGDLGLGLGEGGVCIVGELGVGLGEGGVCMVMELGMGLGELGMGSSSRNNLSRLQGLTAPGQRLSREK